MRLKESALITLGMLLLLHHQPAAGASGEGAGEAFSDPAVTQEMPESWANQPVKHDPAHGKADVVINLNRQVYEALHPLIVQFEKENGVRVAVTKGTCGISAGLVKRKEADIVMLCCPPGKVDRLPGIEFHTVGIMPLALLVHPDNPVDDITLEKARQVFRGEISRWSELSDPQGRPGKNTPIQVIARRHCKKRPGHWKLLIAESDLFSPKVQEVGAIPDMIQLIADNPSAIGYEVMQMVREYEDKGDLKPLKINGYGPESGEALLSGEYPLYRTYSFTTWQGEGVDNPHARRLVEYIMARAENVDDRYGLVSHSDMRGAGWKFMGNELVGAP
jgi:phosphate transport system substrate-binding protein